MAINVFDSTLDVDDLSTVGSLRWSRFAHSFQKDGVTALFHSLTHQVLYFPTGLPVPVIGGESIASDILTADIIQKLVGKGFLVSSKYEEQGVLDQIREQFLAAPSYGILYLLLTDACNLRCEYCVIEGTMPPGHTFTSMSEEVAFRGIDLFVQLWSCSTSMVSQDKRSATIIFYGGEPLMNKKVFLAAVNRIGDMKKQGLLPARARISLITNGTILDDDLMRCFLEHDVSVSFSIDGPQEIHDANRVTVDGNGTFKQAKKSLMRCKEVGVNVSISCTISPANIDNLPQIMEWFVDELGVTGMGLNLLLDRPGYLRMDPLEYAVLATRQIIKGYEVARRRGIYEDRMMRKIEAFVLKKLHLVDCGGCGGQIVVTPDGLIGPCHMYMPTRKHFPTTVWDADYDFFGSDLFLKWTRRSPINMPGCWDCPALGSCGGGCLYNADMRCSNMWQPDPGFCIHSKMILEWLIWDLFKHESHFKD